jgi:hypothetical protein
MDAIDKIFEAHKQAAKAEIITALKACIPKELELTTLKGNPIAENMKVGHDYARVSFDTNIDRLFDRPDCLRPTFFERCKGLLRHDKR